MKDRGDEIQNGFAQVDVLITAIALNLSSYGDKPRVINSVLNLGQWIDNARVKLLGALGRNRIVRESRNTDIIRHGRNKRSITKPFETRR